MKLIELVSIRTFILNYKFKSKNYFWNEIYNLLSTKASCSPNEQQFMDSIKMAKIYKSNLNPNSIFIHLELVDLDRIGFLLIKFINEIEFEKDWKIKYLYILVSNEITIYNDYGFPEFFKLYNNVSIEEILDNAKDPYIAFHIFKQFLSFSKEDYNNSNEEQFDVYGVEED